MVAITDTTRRIPYHLDQFTVTHFRVVGWGGGGGTTFIVHVMITRVYPIHVPLESIFVVENLSIRI